MHTDDAQIENMIRNGSIDPKSPEAAAVYNIMLAKQRGIRQTLDELTQVMSIKNILEHVLNYIPDLRYFYIDTQDSHKIKKGIVRYIKERKEQVRH